MADARALLRQQRAARRITHPQAAYSDTGKLLCTLCREQVRSENLWEPHLKSEGHRKRASAQKQQQQRQPDDESSIAAPQPTTAAHKRKFDEDEEMGDAADSPESQARRKRSRPETASPASGAGPDDTGSTKGPPSTASGQNGTPKEQLDQISTPPSLTRRSSTTPSQGVEVQIPSRPATPRDSNSNSASTTKTLPSRQASTAQLSGVPTPIPENQVPKQTAAGPSSATGNNTNKKGAQKPQVDEDEWAAFEADIEAASYDQDEATISAPAMTAAESAAAQAGAEEEDDGDLRRRKTALEAELAAEQEDARRAFEDEMDEMNNLEAKVLRLKEQRDALRRRRAESQGQQDSVEAQQKAKTLLGKENAGNAAVVEEGSDEEDDDDEDEDDWDGFRFRAAVAR
ncbi:unnamed protein product [Clonostachys rhizophaga]|uniref:Coiled-coil domain-containing protein 16 n=1 Tax=Clonostachys rhizophaga TaxID=160324 RepID=A0A9N9YM72_9HYPO|nr:unnamed protein product [Clonostachys rhizophaga]